MSDTIAALRLLVQIGITVEQYQAAVSNPDLSDDALAALLSDNQGCIDELLDAVLEINFAGSAVINGQSRG